MSSVVKVIEIIAQSDQGWEQAAQAAVDQAAKTLHNIKAVYIKDMQAKVENNKITEYRVTAKLSFKVDS